MFGNLTLLINLLVIIQLGVAGIGLGKDLLQKDLLEFWSYGIFK
jgi:hypothetical protein